MDLRKAGQLRSKKGPAGGHALVQSAGNITFDAVIRALEGPIDCASQSPFRPCEDCDDIEACIVRSAMCEVRRTMAAVVDEATIADLASRAAAYRPEIDLAI